MLDRLRQSTLDDDEEPEDLGASAGLDFVQVAAEEEDLILGLTPAQRLVLSVFLFLDITVVGCMLLLALGKIHINL